MFLARELPYRASTGRKPIVFLRDQTGHHCRAGARGRVCMLLRRVRVRVLPSPSCHGVQEAPTGRRRRRGRLLRTSRRGDQRQPTFHATTAGTTCRGGLRGVACRIRGTHTTISRPVCLATIAQRQQGGTGACTTHDFPSFLSLHSFFSFSSFWMVPVRTARVLRGSFFPFRGKSSIPAQFPSVRSHFELNTYFSAVLGLFFTDTRC